MDKAGEQSLDELIDRITPENQHIPERCKHECGDEGTHDKCKCVICGAEYPNPEAAERVAAPPEPAADAEGFKYWHEQWFIKGREVEALQAKVSTLEQALRTAQRDTIQSLITELADEKFSLHSGYGDLSYAAIGEWLQRRRDMLSGESRQ